MNVILGPLKIIIKDAFFKNISVLIFTYWRPGNNYKHKSEHELFLFGSPLFALIKSYVYISGRQFIQDSTETENTINQSRVNYMHDNNKILAFKIKLSPG